MNTKNKNIFLRFLICVFGFWFLIFNFACSKQRQIASSQRIISLVPSITEIVFALEKESLLVGNTIYCDFPEGAKQIYKVGDFSSPSLEKILKRKPTLVLATLPEQKTIVEQLKQNKIPVFTSRPRTVDSVLVEIIEIGQLIGAKEKAEILTVALKNKLKEINQRNPNIIDSPKVYIEISSTPIMTIGNLSYINDLIRYAGAKNVFGDIDREYIVTNSEELITRNPDVILILHPSAKKAQVRKRMGWSQITAIKKGRIYDILPEDAGKGITLNPDYFFRPGPRFIYGVEDLANILKGIWGKRK
jgi:iron complex transport system substrate-binding protein